MGNQPSQTRPAVTHQSMTMHTPISNQHTPAPVIVHHHSHHGHTAVPVPVPVHHTPAIAHHTPVRSIKTLSGPTGTYTPQLYFLTDTSDAPNTNFITGPATSTWSTTGGTGNSITTTVNTNFYVNYLGQGNFTAVIVLVSLPPGDDTVFQVTPFHAGDPVGSFSAPGTANLLVRSSTGQNSILNARGTGIRFGGKNYFGYTFPFNPSTQKNINFRFVANSSYLMNPSIANYTPVIIAQTGKYNNAVLNYSANNVNGTYNLLNGVGYVNDTFSLNLDVNTFSPEGLYILVSLPPIHQNKILPGTVNRIGQIGEFPVAAELDINGAKFTGTGYRLGGMNYFGFDLDFSFRNVGCNVVATYNY